MPLQTFEFYTLTGADCGNETAQVIASGPHRIFIDGIAGLFHACPKGELVGQDSRDLDTQTGPATIVSVEAGLPGAWVGAIIRISQCFDINGVPTLARFQITQSAERQACEARSSFDQDLKHLASHAIGGGENLVGWLRRDVAPDVGDSITFASDITDADFVAMMLDLPSRPTPNPANKAARIAKHATAA